MEILTDSLKKVMLAGIGAMATTAEKARDILDEMAKKGELTVEQGKILNQELKHRAKETIIAKKAETDDFSSAEAFRSKLQSMTPEQIEQIHAILQEMGCEAEKKKESTGEQQESGEEECK